MSVESDLYDALKGLVGNRVFPDIAPFDTPRPYITYQQLGGRVINYTDPSLPDKQNGEFQINVWGDTRASVAALMLQVDAALRGAAAFVARPLAAPVSRHEPELERYGALQDFSIWSSR